MKAEQLAEATKAVETIKSIDLQLGYTLSKTGQQLVVEHAPRSNTYIHLNQEVAAAALEMQRELLRKRRAQLVRRLNQLGVVL